MGVMVGESGGIAVLAEAIYGTTGTVLNRIWMPMKSSNITNFRELMKPTYLVGTPSKRRYSLGYSQGQSVLPFCKSRAVSQIVLDAMGDLTTSVYAFPGTPDNDIGVTVWQDSGGHRMRFNGCLPTKFTWTMKHGDPVLFTIDWLGRIGVISGESAALSMTKTDDDIMMWSDIASTMTINSAAVLPHSATIEVGPQMTGPDRWSLGATSHRRPQRWGAWDITGSITLDLDDTASGEVNNTVAVITSLLAYSSTAIGTIQIGDWVFSNCWFTGELPTVDAGITPCVVNFIANSLALTTTA